MPRKGKDTWLSRAPTSKALSPSRRKALFSFSTPSTMASPVSPDHIIAAGSPDAVLAETTGEHSHALSGAVRTTIDTALATPQPRCPGVAQDFLSDGELPLPKKVELLVGDAYLKNGNIDDALNAYRMAGVTLTREHLLAIADLCLKQGRHDESMRSLERALALYREAGVEPQTCPTFAKNGDKWLKKGSFARALWWYQAAGYQKLIDFGDRCLEVGGFYYDMACRAYALAGAAIPPDKLVAFGERCLKNPEYAGVALKVFQAAGDPAKVRVAVEKCLEGGHLDLARETYAAAGEEMPADKVRACGDACIKNGHANKAREAYRLALANCS